MIQIINGNALDELKKLPDGSVDCVITSPPYYGLRSYKGAETIWGGNPDCKHEWSINISERVDYTGFERNRSGLNKMAEKIDGHKRYATTDILPIDKNSVYCSKCGAWKGQLGLEPTYQMYLGHLLMVTEELKRVLKASGTVFWNMGDSYAGKMGKRQGWNDNKIAYTKEEALENGTSFYLSADYGNIQDKSLMMIPERFAIGMIDQGWILRNKIIWRKPNGMPSSVRDRYGNKWEYIFFFVKSRKYFFDLDAVRRPLKESSIKRISQNVQLQFNTGKVHDFPDDNMNMKNILIHMKQKYEGDRPRSNIKHDLAVNRKGSYDDPLHIKAYNPAGANPGDVIDVPLDVDDFWTYQQDRILLHTLLYTLRH
jgi:DNA modification methylase